MVCKYKNIVGKRYGRLTILDVSNRYYGDNKYNCLCRCDCGKECIKNIYAVVNGNTKSCGCKLREYLDDRGKIIEDKYADAIKEIEGGKRISVVAREYGYSKQSLWYAYKKYKEGRSGEKGERKQ